MPEPVVIGTLGSSIGGKLADLTVESIGKQIGYVISYHHNLTEHKKALKELENRRERVQHMVDAAIGQGEEIHEDVKDWISDADKITTEAEEVRARGRQDCSWRSCPNLWLRHQISREAKKMTTEIQEIKDKGEFERVSYSILPELPGVPPTCEENDERIESKISIRNQVLEALKKNNNDMVGLFGLPGVGKTTLASQILKISKKDEFFGPVVWVEVRQDGHEKLKDLQTQVAESVGKKLGEETVNARANILLQLLKDKQRVLVVLDDLWERLDLGLLGIPPADDRRKNKWKILMTSRNVELLNNQMGCKNNFEVDLLTKEEAWKLFKDNAELDESNHRKLIPIAKDVCQRCGGLPLALVAVARALKNRRDESDWKNASKGLPKVLAWNTDIGPFLSLSYEYLKSPELKSIFLLTAILSHDPLINDLLKYVVGLGLLGTVHSMKEAHDALKTKILDLKASSLFLDSYSDDRVTMHDLFREFALKVQESSVVRLKGGQDHLQYMMPQQLKGCTRLVLDKWDKKLPDELPCPNLEFFLLNGEGPDLKIPDNFFKSLNDLTAMQFTGVEFSSLSTLGHLEKLQTLCLESCAILGGISQVGNMKSLRVLSFARSEIRELPQELTQLICLQVLDLSYCRFLKVIPPNVLSSLTTLEVLNMEESFSEWEGSREENRNARLDELKHLTNLYDLNISIPQYTYLPKDFFNGMSLERYIISHKRTVSSGRIVLRNWKCEMRSVDLDDGMQKLLENVQDLHLCDVNVKTDVLGGTLLLPHQCAAGLEHLEAQGCKSIEAIVGSTPKDSIDDVIVFHALRSLKLRYMPMLSAFHKQEEEINAKSKSLFNSKISFPKIENLDLRDLNRMISSLWEDQLPENSFANLKILDVENCGFAGRLVPFHVLKSLRNLQRVKVINCDKVEVVFDFEELNDEEIQSPFTIPFKMLLLDKLPELKHVCSNLPQETVSFPCLEQVEIKKCKKLTSMFPSTELQEEYPLFPHQKISFPKIEELILRDLNRMISSIWDDQPPENSFANLKILDVENCGFAGRLVPFHVLKSLRNLQRVEVRNCDKVEVVFDFEELNGEEIQSPFIVPFKMLLLDKLPELKHVCSNLPQETVSFPCLEQVEIKECERLMSMFPSTELQEAYPLFHQKITFPKIEKLDLRDLNRMISLIWDDQLPENSFANLKTLEVVNCGFAGRLVPFHVLKSLRNLQRVEVGHCNKVEVVFDFEELNGEEIQSPFISVSLKKLSLNNLPELKHVWSNLPQVSFPCLEEVVIRECMRLTGMFPSTELQEEYQLFPHQKVVQNMKRLTCDGTFTKMVWDGQIPNNYFSNLEHLSLYLDDFDDESFTTFRRGLDQSKFPNLQTLELKGYMKELLFSSSCPKPPLDNEVGAPFTTLVFNGIYNLEHIWNANTQSVFLLQNLQTLRVSRCHDLINLGTSFISFTNLTEIQVSGCHKMISLLTSSASRGLAQLTKLKLGNCNEMLQLLEKDDDDLSGKEIIVFQKLEYLSLRGLIRLRSFCNYNYTFKFPSLQEVIITFCSKMRMFCQGDVYTPHLKGVTFDNGTRWEGSLNKTIQHIWVSEVKYLELCPEMRSLWMEQFPQRTMGFSRLEEITIDRCDFLRECAIPTHLVRSLSINLKLLVVRNCQYIKAICGPIMDDEGEARLDDGSDSFQSLRKLKVSECKSLEYIFMASSVAKGLEESPKSVFPHLESLRLEKLHDLKGFCPQRCTFECPRLTELRVSQCENLKVFGTKMTCITHSSEKDESEESQTMLFLAEKVIPNLTTISLSKKDVALIKNHRFEMNLFDEVKDLTLEGFFGESAAAAASFPFDFLGRFPNLSSLGVGHSDFEEIFSSQPQQRAFSSSLEGFLSLAYLDQLNTIWNDDDDDDSLSQPLHLNLERLEVECCPNLIKLTPSSASLANLTHLKVSGCHQLTYMFTYSTAKSLVNVYSLVVKDCKKMKEIVRNESEEDAVVVVGVGGGAGITFNRLLKLELTGLPSLEGFCLKNLTFQFPNLRTVIIEGCHQMKMFSLGVSETPDLSAVKIDDMEVPLKGDLNKTIELFQLKEDGAGRRMT